MIKYQDIRHVHVEFSTYCNAYCPRCVRNFYGSDYNGGYPLTSLTLETAQKIFKPAFLQQINEFYVSGNFGDFIMAKDALEIVKYVRSCNSNLGINIGTNASGRSKEFWQELAGISSRVEFCLDGLEDTHHLYRVGTDYNKILANAAVFIKSGGYAVWKMTLFDHNQHQVETARELANNLGFASFWLRDHGRDSAPVFNRQGTVRLHTIGKNLWGTMSRDQLMENLSKQKQKRLDHIPVSNSFSCLTKNDKSIYIDAAGNVFPCCYIGHFPETFNDDYFPGTEQIKNLLNGVKYNAIDNDLEQCIEWFNKVEESWKLESFEQGKLIRCSEMCGQSVPLKVHETKLT